MHTELHVHVGTKLQWLTMDRVLFYNQIISFKFQFFPRETRDIKSADKEMQGKKLNLHTKTDWNIQSFTDLVLQVTWKEKL